VDWVLNFSLSFLLGEQRSWSGEIERKMGKAAAAGRTGASCRQKQRGEGERGNQKNPESADEGIDVQKGWWKEKKTGREERGMVTDI